MISFNPNYLVKTLSPDAVGWGLGLQRTNLQEHNLVCNTDQGKILIMMSSNP